MGQCPHRALFCHTFSVLYWSLQHLVGCHKMMLIVLPYYLDINKETDSKTMLGNHKKHAILSNQILNDFKTQRLSVY
jgi:hypothetical protein